MITEMTMYWITRCNEINCFGLIMFIIGIVATSFCFLGYFMIGYEHDAVNKIKNALKFTVPIMVIGGLIATFVPTTRDMCAIKVIPRITNNEKVQDLGSNIIELANDWGQEPAQQTRV